MKKISKIVLAVAAIAGLWSCEGEDNLMFVQPQTGDFTLNTPDAGTAIILTADMPQENVAATFTWDAVDYGTPTEVTYEVQFAKNGTDFAEPMSMSTSTLRSYAITVAQLNNAALGLDLIPEEAGAIDVRVIATVGTTGSEPKISNTLNIVVTPYPSDVKRQLYFVGSSTSAGWDNNNMNVPMYRDNDNDNRYVYSGYFGAGEFKLLEVKGQWQPQWGQNGGVLAVNDGSGSDPGSFAVGAAGFYTLIVNLTDMVYTFEPYAGDTSVTFPTVGIIGSATPNGWDASTAMTQNAADPHQWSIMGLELINGEAKFRANNAWDVNWGQNTAITGIGAPNGPNIPVEAGTYDVYFNDLDGRYIFIPVE